MKALGVILLVILMGCWEGDTTAVAEAKRRAELEAECGNRVKENTVYEYHSVFPRFFKQYSNHLVLEDGRKIVKHSEHQFKPGEFVCL